MVSELHNLFNNLKRYSFPFVNFRFEIPKNGIYILFEEGEKFIEFDRIVRVGTHSGNNQLYSRLNQHFIKENKNRSIFRKNIGRCFLNKEENPYQSLWELDTTSRVERERNLRLLDTEFEKQIEKKISNYIQTNLTFCVFKVRLIEERVYWERKIASTLAQSSEIKPSENWLGNHSPKEKIRASGLWQVNELNKEVLTKAEFEQLKYIIITDGEQN